MALALKTTYHKGFRNRVDRHSDASNANTQLTLPVPAGELRQLLFATVKYSGAASTTITVWINSGAGAAYDVLLDSRTLSANTDYVYIPDGEILLADDDSLVVTAPAVVGVTSAITVYTRVI